jgi:hypothetical protein
LRKRLAKAFFTLSPPASQSTLEKSLEDDIKRLKAEIYPLDPVSDFAARSKLERKVIAAEKELGKLPGRGTVPPTGSQLSRLLTRFVQPCLLGGVVFFFWSEPMLVVSPSLIPWPLSWFVVGKGGVLGVSVWTAICFSAAGKAVPVAANFLGLAPQRKPAATGLFGLLQNFGL